MFLKVDKRCWRCKKDIDTMIHIWWFCPALHEFWEKVHFKITTDMGIVLKLITEVCLLHQCLGKYDNVLLSNLLIAAKLLIAKKWKSEDVPTIYEWQNKCLNEQTKAIFKEWNGQRNALSQFRRIWERFLNYWNKVRLLGALTKEILEIV